MPTAKLVVPGRGFHMLYFAPDNERNMARYAPGPFLALCAFAFGSDKVNLMAIDHNGTTFSRTEVPLLPPGQAPAAGGHYCWVDPSVHPVDFPVQQKHPETPPSPPANDTPPVTNGSSPPANETQGETAPPPAEPPATEAT